MAPATTVLGSDSNGRLDFVVANESGGYVTACLPPPPNIGPYDNTIFPLWEDLRTDAALSGCSGFPGGTCGVFTSVSGVAPNRIFNIEWRAVLFNNNASRHNFEVRLYENSVATNKRFDVIFGSIDTTGFNHPYVSGVEGASGFLTQDFCNPASYAEHLARLHDTSLRPRPQYLLAPFRVKHTERRVTSMSICH